LDHSDSGREGCTVTTLTITAEPKNWQNAIRVAVHEVCFLCCASPVFVMVQFFIFFSLLVSVSYFMLRFVNTSIVGFAP